MTMSSSDSNLALYIVRIIFEDLYSEGVIFKVLVSLL